MAKRTQKRKPWSKDDVKKLKKIFRNTNTKDVAKELKRSYAATQAKASQLKLTKTKKYLKSVGLAK
jgi:hypothetical protein